MTSGNGDDDAPGGFASPPCFMHELDPAYAGLPPVFDARQHADVMRWRKAERERLLAERLAIEVELRRSHAERIAAGLDEVIAPFEGVTVSLYWPFRGEPDLRRWMEQATSRGARCALPVVVAKGAPLVFRVWEPGARMERGVWNIHQPADGAEVMPDVVIAPVVGFDPCCYRLGYGGGFFDRTLAAMPAKPRAIGVGYAAAAIPTIYPQPHDIPMDLVVTESGVVTPRGEAGTRGER
jgi:5-formyltetrahydrofolate cyclo-ligase